MSFRTALNIGVSAGIATPAERDDEYVFPAGVSTKSRLFTVIYAILELAEEQ
jgi:hypothetical protein